MSSTAAVTPAAPAGRRPLWHLFIPLLGGLLVAETLGILARESAIDPSAYPTGYFRLFFSDPIHLKSWFATLALTLAASQFFTAAWIFRKLYWRRPPWINVVHRWSGRLAFAATIPVAYHCVFKLGFQTYDPRVLEHAFFGTAVYGAFTAKVLIVRMHRFPGWALPLAGGLLFVALVAAWWTSAFYFLKLSPTL